MNVSNQSQAQAINEQKQLTLCVTEALSVHVMPDKNHEFLMTNKQVARGYGASEYSIRMAMSRNSSELLEGKHFIKGVTICHTLSNAQPHQVFWTKRGIVRLGFFIKSERSKLFRDWAEDLVLNKIEQGVLFATPPQVQIGTEKRKHNRLTPDRLLSIMGDVVKIEDSVLRSAISSKLLNLKP